MTTKNKLSAKVEEFNRKFSATLTVKLDTEDRQETGTAMEFALPGAGVTSVSLRNVHVYTDEFCSSREPTDQELDAIVIDSPTLSLIGEDGTPVLHRAPNGKRFRARDVLKAVEETERQTRGNTNWFGGVDLHHVFFEGLYLEKDGSFRISWGS